MHYPIYASLSMHWPIDASLSIVQSEERNIILRQTSRLGSEIEIVIEKNRI